MADAILRSCTVYGLRDSRVGSVRYIGQTYTSMSSRLKSHLWESRNRSDSKAEWIKSVVAGGGSIEIFAIVENAIRHVDEVAQIKAHSESGCDLLNVTGGGGGLSNCDAATREKLSRSTVARFKSSAEREKTSSTTREAMKRPEVIEKVSAASVITWSDGDRRAEQARKVSERFSRPEERAAQAERRAKLTNNEVLEARRMRRAGATLNQLCQMFGIAQGPMSMLCNGKTFKHLPI